MSNNTSGFVLTVDDLCQAAFAAEMSSEPRAAGAVAGVRSWANSRETLFVRNYWNAIADKLDAALGGAQ